MALCTTTATVIMEDPYDISLILPDVDKTGKDVRKRRLTDEEVEQLNKGIMIIDLEDMEELKEQIRGDTDGDGAEERTRGYADADR